MASPVSVSTTVTLLSAVNLKRDYIYLQNNGTVTVYIRKASSTLPVPQVDSTTYDWQLDSGEQIAIKTIGAVYAVAASTTANVGVMETIFS